MAASVMLCVTSVTLSESKSQSDCKAIDLVQHYQRYPPEVIDDRLKSTSTTRHGQPAQYILNAECGVLSKCWLSVGKKYSGQLLGSGRNVELVLNKSERGTLGANVELRLRGNWYR
jgi:hypothetical protein